MVAVNFYYFFLRRLCVGQCLTNLVRWPDGNMKEKDRKLALELLVVSYLSGICMVPGGHQQFQIWYQELIPMALAMTGLPLQFLPKLWMDVWPSRLEHPNVHHLLLLALCIYLLSAGTPRK